MQWQLLLLLQARYILNYWAGMEEGTAGDLEVLSKGCGVIRIMSTNLRRVKRDETGQDMSTEGALGTDNASSGGCCSGHLGSTGHRGGGWWCTRAGSTVEFWEAER